MNEDMLKKHIQEAIEEMPTYAGGWARLWKFTASHSRLVIEIEKKGESKCRYLNLAMCTRIETPVAWQWDSPSIAEQEDEYWILQDKKVFVKCDWCGIRDESD